MFEKKSLVGRRRQEPFNLIRQMTAERDRMFDEPWTMFRSPAAEKSNGRKISIQDAA